MPLGALLWMISESRHRHLRQLGGHRCWKQRRGLYKNLTQLSQAIQSHQSWSAREIILYWNGRGKENISLWELDQANYTSGIQAPLIRLCRETGACPVYLMKKKARLPFNAAVCGTTSPMVTILHLSICRKPSSAYRRTGSSSVYQWCPNWSPIQWGRDFGMKNQWDFLSEMGASPQL